MLGRIRKLFSKKVEKINRSEVFQFIDNKAKEETKAHEKKLVDFKDRLSRKINTIHEKLRKLEQAKLQNKNIPHNHLNIMKGNREAYIVKTKRFLEELQKKVGDIGNQNVLQKILGLDTMLDDYNKLASKPYRVLQEFFANEAKEIALSIKSIDDDNNRLKKELDDETANIWNALKEKLSFYKNELKKREKLAQEKRDIISKQEVLNKKIKRLQAKKDKIYKTPEYKEYMGFIERLKDLESRKNEDENTIYTKLATLGRALKKTAKISLKYKIIEEFEKDSLGFFFNKSKKEIKEVFDELEDKLKSDAIDMKERVKDKNLATLKFADELFELRHNTKKYTNEITRLQQKSEQRKATLCIDEIEADIESTLQQKSELENSQNKLQKELENIKPKETYESIIKGMENMGVIIID